MKKNIFIILAFIVASFANGQEIIKLDSLGNHLRQFYLNEDVEHNWLAGNTLIGKLANPIIRMLSRI